MKSDSFIYSPWLLEDQEVNQVKLYICIKWNKWYTSWQPTNDKYNQNNLETYVENQKSLGIYMSKMNYIKLIFWEK